MGIEHGFAPSDCTLAALVERLLDAELAGDGVDPLTAPMRAAVVETVSRTILRLEWQRGAREPWEHLTAEQLGAIE